MPSKYDSKSGSPKKSRVQKYRGGGAANPRAMKEQQRAMLQRSFVPQGLTPAAPRPRPTPPSNAPGMGGGMGLCLTRKKEKKPGAVEDLRCHLRWRILVKNPKKRDLLAPLLFNPVVTRVPG